MELKPYFVELRVGGVVMAASQADALLRGETFTLDIVRDAGFLGQSATLVRSIEHLQQLDPELTGQGIPYGGQAKVTFAELLPYENPRDAKTLDMFEANGVALPAGAEALEGCK